MKTRHRQTTKLKHRSAPTAKRRRGPSTAELQKQLDQRTRQLTEALEQQTATSEVLQVISKSPGELNPVFQAVLENATRICEAKFGTLFRFDGDKLYPAANVGTPPALIEFQKQRGPFEPAAGSPLGRVLLTKEVTHTADEAADPNLSAAVKYGGARTIVRVPMLKDNELIGAITIYRQEVRPFTDKQIALVTNFATQAVIAIENTRLLNELRQRTDDLTETLEQQTATSEVLQVISKSPGELEPVFETMLANATRICGAAFGAMLLCEGDGFRRVALHNAPRRFAEYSNAVSYVKRTAAPVLDRLIKTRQPVQVADMAVESPDEAIAKYGGARTFLMVPMLKESELIGVIGIYRQEVRSFTEKQIALVTNFAAQAVIAIENTRLLAELRQRTDDLTESLDQQTAMAEVLRVISSSPTDLAPVFDTILTNATRLCEGNFAALWQYDGDALVGAAQHNVSPGFADLCKNTKLRLGPEGAVRKAAQERRTVQVADITVEPGYSPVVLQYENARTVLAVPLLREKDLVGVVGIWRREVQPFTEQQIALVQNFANQAVIAIENARLLNELRETLQQQTATADVLKVISRSTFDLQTVLDTLLSSAIRLCGTARGMIFRYDGDSCRAVAANNLPPEFLELWERTPVRASRATTTGRALLERRPVQIVDVQADPEYAFDEAQKMFAFRTVLAVPMLREGVPMGVISLPKTEVEPFTDKQIALVETFADQAAIAIENMRLFEAEQQRTRELAKSLEDLRTAQDRLVQTQKLASLGQLTAGIAHEIKNPLNFVNNFSGISVELIDELKEALAGVTADGKTRAEIDDLARTLRDNLEKIAQHGKRADAIVKNMLLHSREGSGEHRPVDINSMVEESLNLAYHGARAEKQGFTVTLERLFDPAAGGADVFPQDITRVLLNLIANGFYAVTKRKGQSDGDGYEPTITAATRNLGDRVEISIRDNGTGIPPEVKEKMFNPFFTTKPTGEGTGLGLSLSHDIVVKQHAGSIEVDTQPSEFTEIRIVLPRVAATLPGGRS